VSFEAAPATTGWRTARRQNMHTLRCRSHSSSQSAWTGGLLALLGSKFDVMHKHHTIVVETVQSVHPV